jgi:hypothetical protein
VPNDMDNCPFIHNHLQSPVDADGDGVPVECDLDDNSKYIGDDRSGVFVNIAYGSDLNSGSISRPLASVQEAILKARMLGKPVYVAAGRYGVSAVTIADGIAVFGGFKNSANAGERFKSRSVLDDGVSFKTVFTRSDSPVTMWSASEGVVLGGVFIENGASVFDSVIPSRTLVVASGKVRLEACKISGNRNSQNSEGIYHGGGDLTLARNFIAGGGVNFHGSSCRALASAGGALDAKNNIMQGGSCRFPVALDVAGGNPVIVGNTVIAEGSSRATGVARAFVFRNSNPTIINNVFAAAGAPDRYALSCQGAGPSQASSIQNNVFAVFSAMGVVASGCDGTVHRDGVFGMGDAGVASNAVFDGILRENLFDDAYVPVSALLIDSGMDVSGMTDVLADYRGLTRPRGGKFDIGAIEK